MVEEGKTNLNKGDFWKATTFVLAVSLIVILFIVIGGNMNGNSVNSPEDLSVTGNIKVMVDDSDPVFGNPNAEISLIEFSDFECSFCETVESGALVDLKNSQYFKDGTVNIVYKHFPLTSIHPFAQKSAEASICAQNQGKFWEYHDILFANQQKLDVNSLKNYASNLGLNLTEFNSCLDNGDAKTKISRDTSQANAAGAQGTPYFVVINNQNKTTQVVSGAVPWANFEAAINAVM